MVGERRTPIWGYIAALVLLCLVSRLPQLLSRNLMVDGDEAVVGLMAQRLATAHEFPGFFWGQRYGLSTVEAAFAAAALLVGPGGPIALKASMLALWTAGVLFLFLACANLLGRRRAFWLAAVFVLAPTWAIWSMKARGGYVTAFTGSSALLWLITRERGRQGLGTWLAAAVLTYLVYLAQPLWLPGLLPVIVASLVWRRSALCAAAYSAFVAAAVFLMRTSSAGSAAPAFGNVEVSKSVPMMALQTYRFMTGWFDTWLPPSLPGPVSTAFGWLGCGVLLAFAGLQIYRLVTWRLSRWSHLLFLAIAMTFLGELVFMHARDERYLLPVVALMVLLGGVEVSDLCDRGALRTPFATGAVAILLVLGAASMREFASFSYLWVNPPASLSETERIRRLLTYLHVEGATRVFSMNGLLDTQLAFYSDEQVIARSQYMSSRNPAYVEEADRALQAGERVAVVGYTNTSGAPGCWDVPICTGGIESMVPNPEQIYIVDGKYFAYVGATRELLERLRFRFPE